MASSQSETSDCQRRKDVRKALAEARAELTRSRRHFWIVKDKGGECVKLARRGRAEVAAAIMGEDQGPEHDFVGAAAKQGFLRQSADQRDSARVVIALVKRLGERPRIGNANQGNVSEFTAPRLSACVKHASRELRRAAPEWRSDRPQRFATESQMRCNNLAAHERRPENRSVRASKRKSSATTVSGASSSPLIILQPREGRCSARYGEVLRHAASGRRRQSHYSQAKRERPAFETLRLPYQKGRPRALRAKSLTVVRYREGAKHHEFPLGNAQRGKHVRVARAMVTNDHCASITGNPPVGTGRGMFGVLRDAQLLSVNGLAARLAVGARVSVQSQREIAEFVAEIAKDDSQTLLSSLGGVAKDLSLCSGILRAISAETPRPLANILPMVERLDVGAVSFASTRFQVLMAQVGRWSQRLLRLGGRVCGAPPQTIPLRLLVIGEVENRVRRPYGL